jgi:hypothetical protein
MSGQQPTARALAPADRQLKFLAPPHPGCSGKHDIGPGTRRYAARGPVFPSRTTLSGAQTYPALPAARRKDRTARARSHAQPEPVSFRPTAVVRLKCALAHCDSRCGAAGLVRVTADLVPRSASRPAPSGAALGAS